MSNTTPLARKYSPQLEKEMRAILALPEETLKPLYGMMHYHMGWADQDLVPLHTYPGKHTRPFLLLLVCEAVSGDWHTAIPAAGAVELLHNFSLIHDDIEDHSPTRRGRSTVWSLWGIPHAVNVGDIMFAHAYLAISRLQEMNVSEEKIRVAFTRLNQTCISLCQGQYLDLEFEDRAQVDMALYMKMIENKTAALIACATEIGAVVGGASPAIVEHYRQFGRKLGLGFQIMDDILGIWGDPRITGKPICDDLRTKKKTLPVLHALETERKRGKRTLRDLYSRDEISDDDVERMLAVLEETGSHQYAREVLSGYRARALEELGATGIDNQAQQTLISLSVSALDREY